jgi:cell wall assembly regulator SMI1
MRSVDGSLKRIMAWYEANVAEERPTLSAGATEREISELETLIGMQLPNDVKQSYRLHNGNTDGSLFPYGYHLLSIREVVKNWRMLVDAAADEDPAEMEEMIDVEGPVKKVWWHAKWIPITGNSGADFRFIDMDPAEGGKVGQVVYFNHEEGPKRLEAASWREYLSRFAEGLEKGEYLYKERDGVVVPKAKSG